MSFTQSDIDRLDRAIASGRFTVEIDGRRVTYRTMSELLQAKTEIQNAMAASSGGASRQSFSSFSRG